MNPLEQLAAMQGATQQAPQPAMQPPMQQPPQEAMQQLAQQQAPPRAAPAPTAAQTVAAVHRFSSIRAAMSEVIKDPKLGKENIRPKLLDAASKLLAGRVLTLPEVMTTIKDLPDEPIAQRKFVETVFAQASAARASVLDHHSATPEGAQQDEWSPDNNAAMMSGLMEQYKNG